MFINIGKNERSNCTCKTTSKFNKIDEDKELNFQIWNSGGAVCCLDFLVVDNCTVAVYLALYMSWQSYPASHWSAGGQVRQDWTVIGRSDWHVMMCNDTVLTGCGPQWTRDLTIMSQQTCSNSRHTGHWFRPHQYIFVWNYSPHWTTDCHCARIRVCTIIW